MHILLGHTTKQM